jgi:protein-S-isoprenylcysteine O-methyltransferase Ste14
MGGQGIHRQKSVLVRGGAKRAETIDAPIGGQGNWGVKAARGRAVLCGGPSGISSNRQVWSQARECDHEQELAIFGTALFLALAPGIVAGLLPWWMSGWERQPPLFGLPIIRAIGILLILIGTPVLLDSFARFALQGLGTPAPVLPTRHLVVSGLYRYVRNPMYLAVAATIIGQGLYLGDLALLGYGALVGLAFHLFVLGYEEPTLRRSFGGQYDAYCANVPRWLPRLRPWHSDRNA